MLHHDPSRPDILRPTELHDFDGLFSAPPIAKASLTLAAMVVLLFAATHLVLPTDPPAAATTAIIQ